MKIKTLVHKPRLSARSRAAVLATVALGVAAVALLAGVDAAVAGDKNKDKQSYSIHRLSDAQGAFLGVQMQELTDELKAGMNVRVKTGVLISEVIEGSPAEEAGLKDGDVIVAFNGKEVDSPETLQELVADTEVGDEVNVKYVRGKRTRTMKVTMGERSDRMFGFSMPDDFDFRFANLVHRGRLGVRVSALDEDLAQYFGVKADEGLLVLGVEEESMAEEMGVKSGDVVVAVEGEDIHSADDIRDALHDLDAGDKVTVTVVRKKKRVNLEGEMRESGLLHSFDTGSWNSRYGPRLRAYMSPDGEWREEIEKLREEIDELRRELKKSRTN